MRTYCEFVATSTTTMGSPTVGLIEYSGSLSTPLGVESYSIGYYPTGEIKNNNTTAGTGSTWGLNDVIGMIFDDVLGTIEFLTNNTTSYTYTGIGAGYWYPAAVLDQYDTVTGHFSEADWVYTPTSAYSWSNYYYQTPSEFGSLWNWETQIGDFYGNTVYFGADNQEVQSTSGAIEAYYGRTTGKYFFRLVPSTFPTPGESFYGVVVGGTLADPLGTDYDSVGLMRDATNGGVYTNGGFAGWVYPFSTGDPIDVGVDCDAGSVTFVCGGGSVTSYGHNFSTGAYPAFRGVQGDGCTLIEDYFSLIGSIPSELSEYLPWQDGA